MSNLRNGHVALSILGVKGHIAVEAGSSSMHVIPLYRIVSIRPPLPPPLSSSPVIVIYPYLLEEWEGGGHYLFEELYVFSTIGLIDVTTGRPGFALKWFSFNKNKPLRRLVCKSHVNSVSVICGKV